MLVEAVGIIGAESRHRSISSSSGPAIVNRTKVSLSWMRRTFQS
jgi:hypothetical protein